MFRCFVDDSGRHDPDIALVLGGWMARVDVWDAWSDVWRAGLAEGKPIAYYRNAEAYGLSGCFKGFTRHQMQEKRAQLATLVIGPPILGFVVAVDRRMFNDIVKDKVLSRRGKLRPDFRDPFCVAFHEFTSRVMSVHYHSGCTDKIDFIFDGNDSDSALRRCTEVYDWIKSTCVNEPYYSLFGTITPGDDKDLMPLQAADLLAGQMRRSIINEHQTRIVWMWRESPVFCSMVKQSDLEELVRAHNIGFATRRLEQVVDMRDWETESEE